MSRIEHLIKCDRKLIRMLKQDLRSNEISNEDSKLIQAEIERLEKLNEKRKELL